jgi:fused signal recognition particle receptor
LAFNWFKRKNKISTPDELDPAAESLEEEGKQDDIGGLSPALDAVSFRDKTVDNVETALEIGLETGDIPADVPTTPTEEKSSPKAGGFFKRLKVGLAKTRKLLTTDIDDLFARSQSVGEEMFEELEEILITADIGVQTTMDLIERLSSNKAGIKTALDLKVELKKELLAMFSETGTYNITPDSRLPHDGPHVTMIVGVNGVGKTTTIGKLAAKAVSENKKVIIAAADTFRAAATEQLAIWAQRAGAEIVRHKDNADPAAVAFDGVSAALARQADIVYVDTAGRLHTKSSLMEELKKIKRSIAKKIPDGPHETLLVLDATTGQNALSQAKIFMEELGITGLILAKLDGTAKGGIVIAICNTLKIPLKYIGIGEGIEDLQYFDPVSFIDALL